MNEQIRQLADHAKAYANQCTKDYDGDVSWYWMDYYTEKFAELIVRECAEIAYNKQYKHSSAHTRGDCAKAIKEHFGVEE